MSHPILGKSKFVFILGLNTLTDDLVHSLEQERGIGLISIKRQLDKIRRQERPHKTSMTIFMEQAEIAVKNGNLTVVVTGFPSNVEEAGFIMRRCSNMMVLSREEPVESLCIKASGFGYDGMTYPAFKEMIENIERETAAIKELLSDRVEIPVIFGARLLKDRQEFVREQILAFHASTNTTGTNQPIATESFVPVGDPVPA